MADPLFELKNYFTIGNYQAAINEGNITNLSENDKIQRDVYIYRSYIAQKNHKFVLAEISASANASLQAVKLLATYLASEENKEIALVTLKEWLTDGSSVNNPVLQVVAATIYYHEENYEEAMRCVYQSNSLEGLALLIQIYLKINRVDQAEKELKGLQKMDEDATITQLATAWVNVAMGGEKINDGFAIFQDLIEKYGPSVHLLNGSAVCALHTKKYAEAEKYLLQALEKNSSDVDTLTNLIVCYQLQYKSTEIITRQINQLKTGFPNNNWTRNIKRLEESFDTHANHFII